jgi:hypothetical protein
METSGAWAWEFAGETIFRRKIERAVAGGSGAGKDGAGGAVEAPGQARAI